ncbi:MAG: PhzF family phenazine biosynthesis protein [Phormidium sp. BM_Day4_Bin.17]|nr:PhzF family phenazine biosynthesis protein [Phormidium sp. BM_Day4_Bin.17]UCJ13668.1 MAG: PhzF family phenazine biosynthesis protein [Phormidium sp. PBR-2020]
MKLLQIDAFSDRPYGGNPAAVCLLDRAVEESWMQSVAAEMNLSETAFLHREGRGFRLRWFTPTTEVDLCGHATLAAAHALWETGVVALTTPIQFYTRSGDLRAERQQSWIELDFPAAPVVQRPPNDPMIPKLEAALGVIPLFIGESVLDYWLVEVAKPDDVEDLDPDFAQLAQLPCQGVIVTSRSQGVRLNSGSQGDYDFISRFFAPRMGINEDPVTGSAHCCLGPYWGRKLKKMQLLAYQASPRGGIVRVRRDAERVILGGQAVTVLEGTLLA